MTGIPKNLNFTLVRKFKMPKDRYNQQQLLPNFANQRTSDYLLTPEHKGTKKSLTPQPTHPRNNSRASSHGSRRSHDPPPDQFRENSLNVYLHDVQHLVRKNIVGLPGNLSQLFENILQQKLFQEASQSLATQCSYFQRKLDFHQSLRGIY